MATGKDQTVKEYFRKMSILKGIYRFFSSWRLTFWMVALFILYYLTVAVWSEEAFARFIGMLSENSTVKALYLVFLLNVTLRLSGSLWTMRKRPMRLVLSLPFYAGVVLFLFSSFMSVNVRQLQWVLLGEGQVLKLPWEREAFRVVKVESALKRDLLRMDDSSIFDYEPYITLQDRGGRLHRVGAFPPKRVGASYMHVLNFGLAPGVEFIRDKEVLLSGQVALRLIPFGSVDSFQLGQFNYKVYIHIIPNRIIRRGKEVARSYDITSPLYQVEVIKGEKTLFEGTTDREINFDGYRLRFYSPSYWIMLEAARDPFYIPFIVSLFLVLGGGIFYLIGLML